MRYIFHLIGAVVLVLALLLPAGCTKKDDEQGNNIEDKGRIEQMTDQAAQKAEKKIRTPLDKARSTQDLGDDRLETMDKVLQQQQQ